LPTITIDAGTNAETELWTHLTFAVSPRQQQVGGISASFAVGGRQQRRGIQFSADDRIPGMALPDRVVRTPSSPTTLLPASSAVHFLLHSVFAERTERKMVEPISSLPPSLPPSLSLPLSPCLPSWAPEPPPCIGAAGAAIRPDEGSISFDG
jgi:hypothetical protein